MEKVISHRREDARPYLRWTQWILMRIHMWQVAMTMKRKGKGGRPAQREGRGREGRWGHSKSQQWAWEKRWPVLEESERFGCCQAYDHIVLPRTVVQVTWPREGSHAPPCHHWRHVSQTQDSRRSRMQGGSWQSNCSLRDQPMGGWKRYVSCSLPQIFN